MVITVSGAADSRNIDGSAETLSKAGRSVELKQKFYKELAARLHEGIRLRKEDLFINLIEVPKENWP